MDWIEHATLSDPEVRIDGWAVLALLLSAIGVILGVIILL